MKKSIWWLFVMVLALGASAESVTSEMAVSAANAWATRNAAFGAGGRATGEVLTVRDENAAKTVLWHQVSMTGGGMLVVAPVTEIEPIVVALDNNPGELPAAHPLRGILTGDMRGRLRLLGLYPKDAPAGGASLAGVTPGAAQVVPSARAWASKEQAKWRRLLSASLQEDVSVGLMEVATQVRIVDGFEKGGRFTHWSQSEAGGGYCYNYYTPGHAVCGCVATACSALAQFFGATNSVGGLTHMCSYNGQPIELTTKGGEINWSILPSNWGGDEEKSDKLSDEQRQLLGRVASDAGIGVDMMYTDGSSGSFESAIADALKEVFGFKNARYVGISATASDDEEFRKLIYGQCAAGAPVGMGIEGHSVVAVGYGLDSENVDRVRVFMGWAGSGDGWYALPAIDCTAVEGGGSYLSEVVDGVVTMISYDDDDIVPLVGRATMGGVQIDFPEVMDEDGKIRSVVADDNGWFATRVPPYAGTYNGTCFGKVAPFEIGAEAESSENAGELVEALPDWVDPFALLNCTVCYSLEDAKLAAIKEGKSVLRVSGVGGQTNTQMVLDFIYQLDDQNVDDFTNRFVYVFSSSSAKDGDGGDVSYGIFLPQTLDPAERWMQFNGSLAYGFARTAITNVTEDVEDDVESEAVTNVLVTTFAPNDQDPENIVYAANSQDEADAVTASLQDSVTAVLTEGWDVFERSTSGISITIKTLSGGALSDEDVIETDCYVDGETVSITCDEEVTNEVAGVVMACGGWSLTNETTGATLEGTGGTAEFTVASNDVIKLTWDLSKTNAVYVSVAWSDPEILGEEVVTPASGWYPYGQPITLKAEPSVGRYGFERWQGGESAALPEDCVVLPPASLFVSAEQPCKVYAYYRRGAQAPEPVTETAELTVMSYVLVEDEEDPMNYLALSAEEVGIEVPVTKVFTADGTIEIADGASSDVPASSVVASPAKSVFEDAGGTVWEIYMWQTEAGEEGETSKAALSMEEDNLLVWYWVPSDKGVEPEPPDPPEPPMPTEFEIAWDQDLTTLNSTNYMTNLLTSSQFEKSGLKLEDLKVTVPTGFVAQVSRNGDGDVVARLALNEQVLRPVAEDGASSPLTILPNGDGTVTVKAEIANGLQGFWYTLYATDELGGTWAPVKTDYESGEPSVQAKETTLIEVSIVVDPENTRKFYKLVVTDEDPSKK